MVNGGFHVVFGWFGHPTIGLETILGWMLAPSRGSWGAVEGCGSSGS